MDWQIGKTLLLSAAATVFISAAAESSVEHVWSYPSGAAYWVGGTISLGNGGSQVYAQFPGINGFSRLLSAADGPTPTHVWQFDEPALTSWSAIASSEASDLHAVLVYQSPNAPTRTPTLYVHRSSSPTPIWSYDFPMLVTNEASGLHMSSDGRTLVAWVFDQPTGRTRVASFVGNTGQMRWTGLIQTMAQPLSSALAPDGSRLALLGNIASVIVDAQNGANLGVLGGPGMIGSSGHAVSAGGNTVIKSRYSNSVEVWSRTSSGYQFSRLCELGSNVFPTATAISADGGLLCVTGQTGGTERALKTRIFDLTSSSTAPIFADDVVGTGSLQLWATRACLSHRGDVLAIANTGDQGGTVPEVLVYSKSHVTGAWSRTFTYDLPGSALDMELSPNGRHLAVGSKAIHASVLGGGGQIDLFHLNGADLKLGGTPRSGSSATFTLKTTPNAPCALLVSTALSPSDPTALAPHLQLGRNRVRILTAGTADAAGVFTRTLALTPANFSMLDDPATSVDEAEQSLQVGGTFYVQGVRLSPRRFTEDVLTVTILPQQ